MIRVAALFAAVCTLFAPLAAQQRHATIRLEDGQRLEGRVVAMDIEHVSIEVDGKVLRVPSTSMRSCEYRDFEEPDAEAPPEPAVEAAAPPGAPAPRISWTGPLQDPVDPASPESVPVDLRGRLLLKRRVDALDARYPWLAPAAPSQWVSLGLLLLVGSGLLVHLSVHVAGGERPRLGRSVGLGVWYLLTAFGQVALVPVHDLSVSVMVLCNGSLSLFWLCLLFGLTRGQAVIAQVVQLGFGALVFAALELVSSLLGSIGVAA